MSPALRSVSGRIASSLQFSVRNSSAAFARQHLQPRNIQPPSVPSAFRRTQARNYTTGPGKGGETAGSKNPFPIIPLLAILAAGSGGFYFLVQSRKGLFIIALSVLLAIRLIRALEPMAAIEEPSRKPRLTAGDVKKPAFGPGEVSVIFVLGLFWCPCFRGKGGKAND